MAHAVRGFPLLPVYSGGFSVICLICHFNTPVRRFNPGRCPYISAALRALCALFMALWRGVAPSAVHCRLRFQLAPIVRRPCALGGVAGPCGAGADWLGLSAWSLHAGRGFWWGACLSAKVAVIVAGKVAKVAGIVVRFCAKVAAKVASVCGKVATKVVRFAPKS